jgi:PAS domain S-box-containing protein
MSNHKQQLEQTDRILRLLSGTTLAFVGGGSFCRRLIQFFRENNWPYGNPTIIAVADVNPDAPGIEYAREIEIFTTTDYRELYRLPDLQVIMEITHDPDLAAEIACTKPAHIELLDHFQSRYLWDTIQVQNIKQRMLEAFQLHKHDPKTVGQLIEESFNSFNSIISRRNVRARQIELELVENQRIQTQIIQGSTIPTFVIDRNHLVTHWNKALEKLSGWPAERVVGTNHQWAPFWNRERPTMADVIVDQIDEQEIEKLYGSQWRKSPLIEGAYEAELFFSQVGLEGKWLWFTAAPIKAPDGAVAGAIETLWDKTEDRKALEERERHTHELAALCSIYTALSAPWLIDHRIEAALKEIKHFMQADDVCLFLRRNGDQFSVKHHFGVKSESASQAESDEPLVQMVAWKGEMILIESADPEIYPEVTPLVQTGLNSFAYIPISAKGKKAIGVLRISGRNARTFPSGEKHVLELIGNRIGVAIENALLQEQYIKSEEKYRSLFNNDPNPIFIIDHTNFRILDVNERALAGYGYSHEAFESLSFLELGDADDDEVKSGLMDLKPGQSVLFTKKRHFRKGGASFYVNITASHARYGESDVLIATTTDISETVAKEAQLIQASKMTTLGLMAAGMAHEINQPLNVIQIYADLFLKSLDKKRSIPEVELRGMVKEITASVERATGIIRHVRDFARQSEVIKSRIDINAPIRDVFKVLGNQVKMHQIELELKLGADLPLVMADHNRLEQVFINLVTNAIDAMDEKAEREECKGMRKFLQIQTFVEKGRVVITVEDNGIGMSEEVRSKIFEPFFTTKKVGKGTGLGVGISYGIVKDYDGTIEIDSQKGRGTRFSITFPAVSGSAPASMAPIDGDRHCERL